MESRELSQLLEHLRLTHQDNQLNSAHTIFSTLSGGDTWIKYVKDTGEVETHISDSGIVYGYGRTRYANEKRYIDEKGKEKVQKYHTEKGWEVKPFLSFIHKFYPTGELPFVINTEGEKKAAAACKYIAPTVGLQGQDKFCRVTDRFETGKWQEVAWLPELEECIDRRATKTALLLHDADAVKNKGNWSRLKTFVSSVEKFRHLCKKKDIKAYYAHIRPEFIKDGKGIDDLLYTYSDNTEEIKAELLSLTSGRFFQIFNLQKTSSTAIKNYFIAEALKDIRPKMQEADYYLQPDQKVTSLNLSTEENAIWDIPTGGGKTFAVTHAPGNKLILCPTQPLAQQAGRNFHVVMERKEINQDPVQFGTHNAITKFNKMPNCDEYSLIMDEAHNLVLASNKGYKNALMNELVDSFPKYKNTLLLSGTYIPNLHPSLQSLKQIKVRRAIPIDKKYSFIIYKDCLGALEQKLTRGKLNVVFLQSKKRQAKYAKYLSDKGLKTMVFNADTKHLTDHRGIVQYNEVDPAVEVLFVTSLYVEGLSLYNLNIASVHVLSRANEYIIEQLSNRTRSLFPEMVYLYLSEKSNFTKDSSFDLLARQKELLSEAHNIINAGATILSHGDHSRKEINAQILVSMLSGEKQNLIRMVGGELQPDYLGIAYLAVEEKSRANYKNLFLLAEGLVQFDYHFAGIENCLVKHNDAIYKAAVESVKVEGLISTGALIEMFRKAGETYAHEIDTGVRQGSSKEKDIAYKLVKLLWTYSYTDALELVEAVGDDEKKWKRLRRRISYQEHMHDPNPVKTKDIDTIDLLYQSFKVGECYSSEEIAEKVNHILKQNPKTKFTTYSPVKATQELGNAFEIKRKRSRNDSGSVYEIVSTNPIGKPYKRRELPADPQVCTLSPEDILKETTYQSVHKFSSEVDDLLITTPFVYTTPEATEDPPF